MIDFSVCIETMFVVDGDAPASRVHAAARAGFPAVEIWDWHGWDAEELRRAADESGVSVHTVCVETWNDKCALGDPASHDEFVSRVAEAGRFAVAVGARRLVVLAGETLAEVPVADQLSHAAEALRRAGALAAESGLTLLVEVVNREFEEPHALLGTSERAMAVIEEVDLPNVRFLYDRYHSFLNGEPLELLEGRMHLVGHVQVADVPGRHEMGTGSIDWSTELRWLAEHGYDGLIGLETLPTVDEATAYTDAMAVLRAAVPAQP